MQESPKEQEVDDCEGEEENGEGSVALEEKVEKEAEGGVLEGGDRRRRREKESNVRQQQ